MLSSRYLALTIVFVHAATAPVAGQATPEATSSSIATKTYFFKDANANSEYKLYVPTGYRAGVPAPLIVALHGNGTNPDEIIHVRGLKQLADERGYILVAPMGLNPYAGYGSRGPGRPANRPQVPENAGALSELDVMNVIAAVQYDYTIDPRRVYLLGHSMGGAGSLYLGAKYPDRWAGIALFAPGSRGGDIDAAALSKIPVIIFQGKDDTQVLPVNTRRLAAALKRAGRVSEYHEMVGDHSSIIGWTPQNIVRAFEFFEQQGRP